jgi:dipeptidyl aminopeptidase/acylaminoacyl peptidase
MEQVQFASAGRPLRGTLVVPPSAAPAPCAVLCHGFGSYDDDLGGFVRLADFLAAEGFASFRFSFSGSHPSPDKGAIFPASRWVNDALAAIARMESHPRVDPRRIALVGVSVGGGVVVQAGALSAAVRAVVALAPVADGEDWLRYRWCRARGQAAWAELVRDVETDARERAAGETGRRVPHIDVQAVTDAAGWAALLARYPGVLVDLPLESVLDTFRFRPLYYARALSRPLCLVHGDADESVPLGHSRRILSEATGPKTLRIIEGSPHCPWDTPHEAVFQRIALEWLREHLS